MVWILHVKGSDSLSYEDYLIPARNFINNLGAGTSVPGLLEGLWGRFQSRSMQVQLKSLF
ncbi:MAG TPA: hypothetical protein VJ225_05920 [Nitrososphaeraceae archaeon]|nr:hypothetical protein [Nitrososphaeraceae archaeon]